METETANLEIHQLVTFKLAAEKYGVDILRVQEINNVKDFTKIPHTPAYVEGAINLRGKVIPVLNLRKKFGIAHKETDERSKIVIMNVGGVVMGVLVDSVSEVLNVPRASIVPTPPISSETNTEFIQGIARLEQGLIILLDMDKLLDVAEHHALFGASRQGPDDVRV
jgi:purine-binding chemotaxis protein CheW